MGEHRERGIMYIIYIACGETACGSFWRKNEREKSQHTFCFVSRTGRKAEKGFLFQKLWFMEYITGSCGSRYSACCASSEGGSGFSYSSLMQKNHTHFYAITNKGEKFLFRDHHPSFE